MTTEISPRFLQPKHVSLLVAVLFLAGVFIAFALWPETAAAPEAETTAAETEFAVEASPDQTDPTDRSNPSDSADQSDPVAQEPVENEQPAAPTGETLRVAGTVPVDDLSLIHI